ncbi:MAG: QueT transporter family protein [Clostridiales bacterium]|nr:QueT transporter family protein [Clostridiales bacterium]
MKITTKKLARAGVIAGLYTVISMLVFPLAGGAVQIRISEALTILPLFFIEAIPALFVGCLVSNLILGLAIYDILLGSLVTLVSAILTYFIGKVIKRHILKVLFGGIFPIVLNAFFLPLIWLLCYGTIEYVYHLQVIILFIGQTISVYLFGFPLYFAVNKKLK